MTGNQSAYKNFTTSTAGFYCWCECQACWFCVVDFGQTKQQHSLTIILFTNTKMRLTLFMLSDSIQNIIYYLTQLISVATTWTYLDLTTTESKVWIWVSYSEIQSSNIHLADNFYLRNITKETWQKKCDKRNAIKRTLTIEINIFL